MAWLVCDSLRWTIDSAAHPMLCTSCRCCKWKGVQRGDGVGGGVVAEGCSVNCLLCCICNVNQTVQSRVTAVAEVGMSETMPACFTGSSSHCMVHHTNRQEFDIFSKVDVNKCRQVEICGCADMHLEHEAHIAFHQHYTKLSLCNAYCKRALPVESWSSASVRGHRPRHSTFCSAATIKRRMQTAPAVLPGKAISSLLLPAWAGTCRSCRMAIGG